MASEIPHRPLSIDQSAVRYLPGPDSSTREGVRGGNPDPALLPQTSPTPLRIFLQAAHRDLGWNEPEANWLAEDLRVAAALAEAAYDFRLVLGDGGHDPSHAGALLPDALRWVFRDSADVV